ncbi:MAG: 2-enoyl thioester reductase domain-containing protein [Akkermansiaceae bacterium]
MINSATFAAFGQPEDVLTISTSNHQGISNGEVRVKMLAAPINPADINLVQGIYGIRPDLPATAGIEGCGEIIESLSPDLTVGDRVIFISHNGTWQDEVVCPASALLKIPQETPLHQAAMLKVNPLTAWCMLTQLLSLKKGDCVIQNAANSGVGCCVIQIAQLLGIKTINLVRRDELLDELNTLGGDINMLDNADSIDSIREMQPSLALNAVGGDSALRLMDALGKNGLHVTYGAMSRNSLKVPNKFLIFKGIRLHGFWMTEWIEENSSEKVESAYQQLAQWMIDKKLAQPIDSTFSLNEIHAAVSLAQQDKRKGKVLLSMNE